MRKNRKFVALFGLMLAVVLVGRAIPQTQAQQAPPERIVGTALFDKLQREGRRLMMGGPGTVYGPRAWQAYHEFREQQAPPA